MPKYLRKSKGKNKIKSFPKICAHFITNNSAGENYFDTKYCDNNSNLKIYGYPLKARVIHVLSTW